MLGHLIFRYNSVLIHRTELEVEADRANIALSSTVKKSKTIKKN